MAHGNPVPKFYKSVIDDVIEGVRDVFAEEGVDEQVLKELKRRWETKVMQSKATEGFFRRSHLSPQFTLHLPHNLPQALQTSTGVAAGRGIQQFTATTTTTTTAELATSRAGGAILTLPSGLAYPIQIPAGVTLQTASGQLYKVSMPMVVTQAPGGGTVLQNPVQKIFQQLGQQPSAPQTTPAGATQVNTISVQVSGNESLWVQKPVAPQQMGPEEKTLPSTAVRKEATGHQKEGSEISQQPSGLLETPHHADGQAAVPVSKSSEVDCARTAAEMAPSHSPNGGELPMNPEHPLDADDIIELIIMGNELDDSVLLQDEATLSFAEELDTSMQLESNQRTQKDIASDLEEIIQLDGTSDISPKADIECPKEGEDEEIVGIVDAEELKVLDEEEEEEAENSASDNPSLSSTSDTDEQSVDITEEDPLNSGDDVSEQETPDVFDTDNIIVCQYDKVQRSKNRWKFYLKDGVMCFGGKDYVFSKAIGDAEW
ncbi:TFIIA-alpha and beta-like factor [Eublepharis macularius]|uniref:TFIIA-alpha and beta-like factor n=1 Tax=Eublepharis macularius TaxID=481883 RepID=A0AA97JRH9_EUBMA|nr:TFIIA-alpha and beta-like factor [Eublepharis macularius]